MMEIKMLACFSPSCEPGKAEERFLDGDLLVTKIGVAKALLTSFYLWAAQQASEAKDHHAPTATQAWEGTDSSLR